MFHVLTPHLSPLTTKQAEVTKVELYNSKEIRSLGDTYL